MFRKIVSSVLLILILVNSASTAFANESNSNIENKYNIKSRVLQDGSIEKSSIVNGVELVLEEKNDIMKYKIIDIKTRNEEIVIIDKNKDEFIIIKDGKKQIYNRKDYIQKEEYYVKPDISILNNSNMITQGTPSYLGNPYNITLSNRKFIDNSQSIRKAILGESYYWYATYYKEFRFEAFQTLSFVIGVLSLGYSNLITLIGSAITVIDGVSFINKLLNIRQNAYEQQWRKEVTVEGVSGLQYWAGRTKTTTYNHCYEQQTNVEDVKKDVKHDDFENNTRMLDKGIESYLRYN